MHKQEILKGIQASMFFNVYNTSKYSPMWNDDELFLGGAKKNVPPAKVEDQLTKRHGGDYVDGLTRAQRGQERGWFLLDVVPIGRHGYHDDLRSADFKSTTTRLFLALSNRSNH